MDANDLQKVAYALGKRLDPAGYSAEIFQAWLDTAEGREAVRGQGGRTGEGAGWQVHRISRPDGARYISVRDKCANPVFYTEYESWRESDQAALLWLAAERGM